MEKTFKEWYLCLRAETPAHSSTTSSTKSTATQQKKKARRTITPVDDNNDGTYDLSAPHIDPLQLWLDKYREYLAAREGITISKRHNRLKGDIVEAHQFLKCLIRRDLLFRIPEALVDEDVVEEPDVKEGAGPSPGTQALLEGSGSGLGYLKPRPPQAGPKPGYPG
ncbi:hypothetical protein C8J57DRAFT_1619218 [Mycena rebaudengoi]|nr:hypothetical protein C8J57DRAFT_1619218 [Mycena rebaudengoi]